MGIGNEETKNVAIILAGGTGNRMKLDVPKQYVKVQGRYIIEYCMETIFSDENIDNVQIVANELWRTEISECIKKLANNNKFLGYSNPGDTRQLSIVNGMKDAAAILASQNQYIDTVFIHDAARPNLSHELIASIYEAMEADGVVGVLPVLPVKDTVYLSKEGTRIDGLLNRSQLFAGQAPECFRYEEYWIANQNLMPDDILKINGSTEPAILAGMNVVMVDGDENNYKITTIADLEKFEMQESINTERGVIR